MSNDLITVPNTGGKQVVAISGYTPEAFKCDGAGLLEPTVQKATSLTGNGSTANPLAVKLSTDAGNQTVFGADGGVYTPAATPYTFTINGSTGAVQTISNGDAVVIAQGNGISTVGSATDTVTVTARLSADAANILGFGTDGGLYATNDIFTAGSWNDATNTLTLTLSGGSTVNIPFVDAVASFLHTHTISDGATSFAVTNGDTTTFAGANGVTVTANAGTETVTIGLTAPTLADVCPSGYFVGAPV